MSQDEHRLGVSQVNLVVRHLKVVNTEQTDIQAAVKEIDQIYGLDGVSFDDTSQVLNVAYDATRVCVDCIEAVLTKHHIEVSHDWWTHFKEGYYRFVDQNVKDNASDAPWSCHTLSSRNNKL